MYQETATSGLIDPEDPLILGTQQSVDSFVYRFPGKTITASTVQLSHVDLASHIFICPTTQVKFRLPVLDSQIQMEKL